MIYRPFDLPDGKAWTERWQQMAKSAGFNGLYLLGHVAYQKQIDDVLAMGFDAATVNHTVRMVNRNEFKRQQVAPILRVSPRAFGAERVIPIVAKM